VSNPFAPFPRAPRQVAQRDPALPEDGIYPDMRFADYHATSAWGSSDLKAMRCGPPAMVPWRRANPSADTDATRIGTACHARILTPDLFDATYAFKPEGMTFSTTAGKAWRAEQGGKAILSAKEAKIVEAVTAAFFANERARLSLDGADHAEASIFWTDPDSGEPCKARPDWFDPEYVYDLKVSRHAGGSVAFHAYREGWMHQSAHYAYGLRRIGFGASKGARLVVIAPKAPHYVYTVEVKSSALDILTLDNVNTLGRMRECRESGEWPGVPEEWSVIAPPEGAIMETLAAIDLSGAEEVDGE
jgi:exodeoxyribonuclease VIII